MTRSHEEFMENLVLLAEVKQHFLIVLSTIPTTSCAPWETMSLDFLKIGQHRATLILMLENISFQEFHIIQYNNRHFGGIPHQTNPDVDSLGFVFRFHNTTWWTMLAVHSHVFTHELRNGVLAGTSYFLSGFNNSHILNQSKSYR